MMGVWGDVSGITMDGGVGLVSGSHVPSWMPLSDLNPQRDLGKVIARSLPVQLV